MLIPMFLFFLIINSRNEVLGIVWYLSLLAYLTAMISLALTILASFYSDILTVPTAIFNEVSVFYNLGATLGFWILLAPLYWNLFPEFLKIYMAIIHTVPLLSHFINTGIT